MPVKTIPGVTGFIYDRVSSMNKRAVGKLTDSNHLFSLQITDPVDYDKKIITLYTQTGLVANDFLEMVNKSKPFLIDGNTDTWKWKIRVPYKFPKIIDIPTSTKSMTKPGIDGQEFKLVLDRAEFTKNSIVSLGSRMYGPRLYAISDPEPYNAGFIQAFTLVSENPKVDFVNPKFLQVGVELELIDGAIGEFDQDLLGLPSLGEEITVFETLSSAYGFEHTITKWADERTLRDSQGNPLDILVYAAVKRNEVPITKNDIRWEPLVEFLMRKQMISTKVSRMIWGKPGIVRSGGSKQELKYISAGVYHRMRGGNYVTYNRGEFNANLIRSVFGDLFYRRVNVKDRKVKLYTNEAGFDVFEQAIKKDALNSGLTLVADSGNRYIQGEGQNLVYNWQFNSMVTRETGKVELIHLKELDLPQTNLEFGQNKKSTPVFLVFDVSPDGDGQFTDNIREVRLKGSPSMTWGYINGRQHYLGHRSSQGMLSANKFPGYTLWMEDRCSVFIEDISRTVLIEEIPQF